MSPSEPASGWSEDFLPRVPSFLLEPAVEKPVDFSTRFRSVLDDSTASVAVEFALLGLISIGLILEVLQVGLFGYQSIALERATYQASRMIKLGTSSDQNFDMTKFQNALCSALPLGMPCTRVIVSVQNTAEAQYPVGFYNFVKPDQSDTIQPSLNAGGTSYCPGGPSSFVYVQSYFAMPAFSLTWRAVSSVMWQGSLVHFIAAQDVFRNEPYVSTTKGC